MEAVRDLPGLARALLSADSGSEVVERAVRAVPELVARADLAGITLVRPEGRLCVPAASCEGAGALERIQHGHGDGPSLRAVRADAACSSPDLAADARWPALAAAAAERGVVAALSVPLPIRRGDSRRASLTAYSTEPASAIDQDELEGLAAVVTLAACAAENRRQSAQLHEAVERRDTIGMAKGILMHRQGIGPEAAFATLCSVSQNTNVKVYELATTLIERHGELDPA